MVNGLHIYVENIKGEIMGLSASQSRLLSLTSRLSDLELQAQTISNAKIRLSQEGSQASNDYSRALDKQVLTVYNSDTSAYQEATVANLTSYNGISDITKQRFIKDAAGKVVVPENVATAYDNSNGDLERFLNDFGYTKYSSATDRRIHLNTSMMGELVTEISNALSMLVKTTTATNASEMATANNYDSNNLATYSVKGGTTVAAVVEALTKVVNSIKNVNSTFASTDMKTANIENIVSSLQSSGATITPDIAKNIARQLQNRYTTGALSGIGTSDMYTRNQFAGLDANSDAANAKTDSSAVSYYTNLFNEIKESGGCNTQSNNNLTSSEWLANQIAAGNLTLVEYNKEGGDDGTGDFEDVSWTSGDSALQFKSDDTDTARAEAKYEATMSDIQTKDKRFDLELQNINTEHTAIQTEMDSVSKVINKNIERSFKIFDA